MKIPDDVFETRCKYCEHYLGRENVDIREEDVLKTYIYNTVLPCRIMALSHFSEVPGECLSYTPTHQFGMCKTCQHCNSFMPNNCMLPEQPNRRQLCIGHNFAKSSANPDYWARDILSVCDKYTVNPTWVDIIRANALAGKAPKNFDPDTMEPIGESTENMAAKRWTELQEANDRKRQLIEEERKRKEEALKEKQISLWEDGYDS